MPVKQLYSDKEENLGEMINLQVHTRCVDDHTAIVELQGEMDVYTTPRAKEAMLDLLEKGITILSSICSMLIIWIVPRWACWSER